MCVIRFLALILIVVGALNWGLWGIFQYDLVASFLGGNSSLLARLSYSLVGLAGLYSLSFIFTSHICRGHGKSDTCK